MRIGGPAKRPGVLPQACEKGELTVESSPYLQGKLSLMKKQYPQFTYLYVDIYIYIHTYIYNVVSWQEGTCIHLGRGKPNVGDIARGWQAKRSSFILNVYIYIYIPYYLFRLLLRLPLLRGGRGTWTASTPTWGGTSRPGFPSGTIR